MAAKKKVAMPQAKNLTPPSATGVPAKVSAGARKKVKKATAPGVATGKRAKKAPDVSIGTGKKGMYW